MFNKIVPITLMTMLRTIDGIIKKNIVQLIQSAYVHILIKP